MSARNGDKSRHGYQRKRKLKRRELNQSVKKELQSSRPAEK